LYEFIVFVIIILNEENYICEDYIWKKKISSLVMRNLKGHFQNKILRAVKMFISFA